MIEIPSSAALFAWFAANPSTITGWQAFKGKDPTGINRTLTIYDTAGLLGGRVMANGKRNVKPGFQLKIKGAANEYDLAIKKLIAIRNALDAINKATITVEGTSYLLWAVHWISDIMFIGYEEKNERPAFTTNGIITLSEV
jgi:hypothetical protein